MEYSNCYYMARPTTADRIDEQILLSSPKTRKCEQRATKHNIPNWPEKLCIFLILLYLQGLTVLTPNLLLLFF
jgi:hypothetical protein